MLPSLSLSSTFTFPFPPKPYSLSKSSFHGRGITTTTHTLCAPPCIIRAPSSMVVMTAKREEEMKEIRAKTTEEINDEIADLKGELFMLRLQRSAREEFKSSEFRRMRKRIARMLTIRRERELEEGIGKRLSRKLHRQWKQSIAVRPPPSLNKLLEKEAASEAEKSS